MSGFTLDGWSLVGVLLAVLAIGLLGGAALGYFTASTDLQRERANASPDPDLTYSWTGAPQHPGSQRLFDQDAPTAAARAIELRGDD